MTRLRKAALIAIGLLVAAASLVSFAESYRALLEWASHHGLHAGWAVLWPVQLDTFIAVGELALFIAMVDRWAARSRVFAWLVVIAGLAASVAGNVGHITGSDMASRVTAAVPPLAAAAALTVGLGVLKRVVAAAQQTAPDRPSTAASLAGRDMRGVARHDAPELAPGDAPDAPRRRASARPTRRASGRVSPADMEARALAELARQPGIAGAELGRAIGASPRTGQRLLARLNGRAELVTMPDGEAGTRP